MVAPFARALQLTASVLMCCDSCRAALQAQVDEARACTGVQGLAARRQAALDRAATMHVSGRSSPQRSAPRWRGRQPGLRRWATKSTPRCRGDERAEPRSAWVGRSALAATAPPPAAQWSDRSDEDGEEPLPCAARDVLFDQLLRVCDLSNSSALVTRVQVGPRVLRAT